MSRVAATGPRPAEARAGLTRGQHYLLDPSVRVLVADLGLSWANIARRAHLPGDLLADGPATVSPAAYLAVWHALADEADDPALPIRIGRAISVEAFAAPVFAALCSPDLRVAADRIARHKPLVGPLRMTVTDEPAGLTISLHWPDQHRPPEVWVTTELVWWVAPSCAAGSTSWMPGRPAPSGSALP